MSICCGAGACKAPFRKNKRGRVAVPPREPSSREEKALGAGDRRGAFGARTEAPRASLWSETKTARTAQLRLSRNPGRTDRMTIDRSPLLGTGF